jgi:hypothetical protein
METAVEEQTFAFVKADIMARRVILVSILMDTVNSLLHVFGMRLV